MKKPKEIVDIMMSKDQFSSWLNLKIETIDKGSCSLSCVIKKEMLNEFEITYANKGKFEESKGVPILILYNGETIRNKDNKITNFKFSIPTQMSLGI